MSGWPEGCGYAGCAFPGGPVDEIHDKGWRFLHCRACGVYRLPPSELLHDHVDADPLGPLPLTMRILFRMRELWLRRTVPEFRRRDARVLDFGCGDGQFLQFLHSRGYHSSIGVEPDARRASNAVARGVQVHESLAAAQAATGSRGFDLIFLWQVLEHVERPMALVEDLLPALGEHGALVVSFPNHASAQTRLFGRWSAYPDYGRHVWFHKPDYLSWLASVFPTHTVRRLVDLNVEYEVFGWVDTLASALMREQNYIHSSLKKGKGGIGRRRLAWVLSGACLPIACLVAPVSLVLGGSSILTFAMRRSTKLLRDGCVAD